MTPITWQGVVDFLVLAAGIYLLLTWSREARALRLALTILGLRVGALLAGEFELVITSWVLDGATIVALLALVVVFQPELRRALVRLDVVGRSSAPAQAPVLSAVSTAAWGLSRQRCGALMVIGRGDSLDDLVTPGVSLAGRVSADVLQAIFQKASPVHDGAALIEGDLIARIGVVLPLTQRADVPAEYGTRHRAALGLAERSDAIVVVVSEERGDVTLMWEGQARLVHSAEDLRAGLAALVGRRGSSRSSSQAGRRAGGLAVGAAAVSLAALIWAATFLFPGGAVRVRIVPLEFTRVPAGLTISSQSTDTVRVRLRGNPFLLDAMNADDLVARCDLADAREGAHTISLGADSLDLPFGVTAEETVPEEVRVTLQRVR